MFITVCTLITNYSTNYECCICIICKLRAIFLSFSIDILIFIKCKKKNRKTKNLIRAGDKNKMSLISRAVFILFLVRKVQIGETDFAVSKRRQIILLKMQN